MKFFKINRGGLFVGSLFGLLLFSCSVKKTTQEDSTQNESMIITIEHYQVPCTGVDVQWCLLYQEKGKDEWLYNYGDIAGFDYDWGYRYSLEVTSVQEENPPMDSPGGHFQLVKVLQKEMVPESTTFELVLAEPGGYNPLIRNGDQLEMMGLTVTTDLPEEQLEALSENGDGTLVGVFQHSSIPNEIKLLNLKTE